MTRHNAESAFHGYKIRDEPRFPVKIVGIYPSPTWFGTTWLTFAYFDGLHETTFECVHGLPTSYPLNRSFNGLTADYVAWVLVQSSGKRAVREYMAMISENAPGADAQRYVGYERRVRSIRSMAAGLRNSKRQRRAA